MRVLHSGNDLRCARYLTRHEGVPSRADIREHISGNYCRCTGYEAIVDAIETTARVRSSEQEGTE